MRSPVILCQTHFTLSRFVLHYRQRSGAGGVMGLHAADKQAVSTGLTLEYIIPSAEHHTFIIIHTADCLTLIMNQQIQTEVLVSCSLSHGLFLSVRAHG